MKTELFIAKRLGLKASERLRRSPAVSIAIAGVALAVVVMLATVSIVRGFQEGISAKVKGFEPSLLIEPLGKYYPEESTQLEMSGALSGAVERAGNACGGRASKMLTQPVVLKTPDSFAGIVLYGYDSNHDTSFEQSNLTSGTLPASASDILLSVNTASRLGLSTGDKVDACFFVDGAVRLRRLTVSGLYSSNFCDYDKLTGYVTFDMLVRLLHLPDSLTAGAIEIRDIPQSRVEAARQTIASDLEAAYSRGDLTSGVMITTVFERGAMYFNWLDLLDMNVVVILVIMSLVSGFMLISCMFILILQRVGMIGTLKSLGATNSFIRRIFLLLGGKVVIIGMILGNAIGLLLLWIQIRWQPLRLDPESYYLDYVPVSLDWWSVVLINFGVVAIAVALMLIPASIISRISPSKTMHYE